MTTVLWLNILQRVFGRVATLLGVLALLVAGRMAAHAAEPRVFLAAGLVVELRRTVGVDQAGDP